MSASTVTTPDLERLTATVGAVCDPELPPLTLVDLGILRSVSLDDDDTVVVTVTPTYSGCPAVEYIESEIGRALEADGCERYRVVRSFTPAWTTDWITDDGRSKLLSLGIAPPDPAGPTGPSGPVAVSIGRRPAATRPSPTCPRCGSVETDEVSRFGSTACKSLHQCRSCAEPFDYVKPI